MYPHYTYRDVTAWFTCVINGSLTAGFLGHLGGEGVHSKHFVKLTKS